MTNAPKTLVEVIYEGMKMDIYTGKIKSGSFLSEQDIADRFNTSRTPVREAFRKLEQDGLIITLPKRGSFVAQITLQDLLDMDEIRLLIEPYLARAAVGCVETPVLIELERQLTQLNRDNPTEQDFLELVKIDDQIHGLISNCSKNKKLQTILTDLRKIKSIVTLEATIKRYNDGIDEHLRTVRALKDKDEAEAEGSMRKHIENARKNYKTILLG